MTVFISVFAQSDKSSHSSQNMAVFPCDGLSMRLNISAMECLRDGESRRWRVPAMEWRRWSVPEPEETETETEQKGGSGGTGESVPYGIPFTPGYQESGISTEYRPNVLSMGLAE
jgi:hypothetical protein